MISAPALNEPHTDSKYHVFDWRGVATLLAREARAERSHRGLPRIRPDELSGNSRRDLEDLAVGQGRALFRTYAASHDVMWVVIGYQIPQTALVRLAAQLEGI